MVVNANGGNDILFRTWKKVQYKMKFVRMAVTMHCCVLIMASAWMLSGYLIQLLRGMRQCLQVPVVRSPDWKPNWTRQTNMQSHMFGGIKKSVIYQHVHLQLWLQWSVFSPSCVWELLISLIPMSDLNFEYLFLSIFSFQLQTRQVTKMHDRFHDLPVSSLF